MAHQAGGGAVDVGVSEEAVMAVVYGDFDSMAACFVNRLVGEEMAGVVFFTDMATQTHGVCDIVELAELERTKGRRNIRPLCCMDRQEFLMLIMIRYRDLVMEVNKDAEKESVQAGKQSGDESADLATGPNEDGSG